jgi:hypothetical protein
MSIFSRRRRGLDGGLEAPRIGEVRHARNGRKPRPSKWAVPEILAEMGSPVLVTPEQASMLLGRKNLPPMTNWCVAGARVFYRVRDVLRVAAR